MKFFFKFTVNKVELSSKVVEITSARVVVAASVVVVGSSVVMVVSSAVGGWIYLEIERRVIKNDKSFEKNQNKIWKV